MKPVITIVDDEPEMQTLLRACVAEKAYDIRTASNTKEAKQQLPETDLLLLDIMMPGEDGWSFLQTVRTRKDPPAVMMISALTDKEHIVKGLEQGADDYITKPFEPAEVRARVEAVLRRSGRLATPQSPLPFALDEAARKIYFHGHALELTKKEYDLLSFFLQRPGRVFTRDQLLEQLTLRPAVSLDRTIDTHIKNIREKLQAVDEGVWIETVWGVGYRMRESP
ncbi:response regulator transcription factor [Alkalicoccus chagannorensis]|uniref:response regulator transcription factor n=1 Tax=Alkalicoccus chagannorensis TaxID=427072 RepID=UPI0004280AC1|nr:response regulator transcription factor [Alkalicoccus chagannorensis]